MYDLVYGIVKKYNTKDMHLHHVISALFLAWPLYSKYNGAEATEAVIQAEITGPCINLSELLPMFGDGYKAQTEMAQITFLISFVLVRMLWSTNSLRLMQLSESSLPFKLVPTGIYILSMNWVWKMVNKAAKLLHEVRMPFFSILTLILGLS